MGSHRYNYMQGAAYWLLSSGRAMPIAFCKSPASEVILCLLEWMERDPRFAAGRGVLAAGRLAEQVESVGPRDAQLQHAPVEVLVLAPRMRQQFFALWQPLHISG